MNKKISALLLFLFMHTNCGDSKSSEPQTPSKPTQNTSESPTDHIIMLQTKLLKGESIIISYAPLFADNIIYSTELSNWGDCLNIRSDYLNAITISYKGKELCDNVDAIQKEYCGSGDLRIRANEDGLYIHSPPPPPDTGCTPTEDGGFICIDYNYNCKPFVTQELEERMEKLHSCIGEFQKYDPNKIPVSNQESIKKSKDCVIKARGN